MACTMEYESEFTVKHTFVEFESSNDWSDLPMTRPRADTDTCIDYSWTVDLSLKGKADDASARATTAGAESLRASDAGSSWWADEDSEVELDDVESVDLDDLASLASDEYYAAPEIPAAAPATQPVPDALAPHAPPGCHLAMQKPPMKQAQVSVQPAPLQLQQTPVPMKTVYVAMMMPMVAAPPRAAAPQPQPQPPQPQSQKAASAAKVAPVKSSPEPTAKKVQDRAAEKKRQPELAKAQEKRRGAEAKPAKQESRPSKQESKASRKKGAKGPQRPANSTTIVLRQLPTDLVRDALQQLLDRSGFRGLYDFLYLPMDFGSAKNFGYGIVNFSAPSHAEAAVARFDGVALGEATVAAEWSKTHSCLESLVQRYRTSPVMAAEVPEACKPLLLRAGRPVPFPAAA